ncbi:hypothetical protein LRS74_11365 [Streptomyces sp. LX-29]|uniref:hypothetical protein n=1 Tax=Streptomyces sp. LX-29 TaxID=2900152 RepID=UPI00240E12C8|nr:hypothetical protein [Streptomyces sp. LX-29]WFB07584.1 hypothetical protein LRS74_11365 [Streptomyces sp. LX-29]
MGQTRILTRGARVFGAVVCAVLGLVSLAWIIRDLDEVEKSSQVWWTWSGLGGRFVGYGYGVLGSSLADLVIVVLCLVVGATALRSSAAAGALGTLAVVVIALRLPSLWNLNADWMDAAPEELASRAQLTAWAGVLLGAALLLTVAAARRPAGPASGPGGYGAPYGPPADATSYGAAPHGPGYGGGYGPPGADPRDEPPAPPTTGGAVTGLIFLVGAGVVLGAWQLYWAQELEWHTYKRLLSGEALLPTLLAPPLAWWEWVLVVLALFAAVAAGARSGYARPLGMIAGALLLADGISDVSAFTKADYLEHFDELGTREVLAVLTSFFELLAGLVALVALAQRAAPGGPWSSGWAHAAPSGGAAPYGGYDGYGQPGPAPGYGYPGSAPGHGEGYGGGYADSGGYAGGGYGDGGGYADGGGYGPPPAAPPTTPPPPPPSRPPGW